MTRTLISLVAVVGLATSALAATASVDSDKATYLPGETITVTTSLMTDGTEPSATSAFPTPLPTPGPATVALQASIDAAQAGGGGRTGSGSGTFTLDTTADTLTFNITFGGLSGTETATHIHGPGPAGGILYGLPVGSPKIGTINLVDLPGPYTVADQKTDLLNELWFVNIHSTTFLGGEIRGQILVVPRVPALAAWGIALLASFLVGSSLWMARRRRAKHN